MITACTRGPRNIATSRTTALGIAVARHLPRLADEAVARRMRQLGPVDGMLRAQIEEYPRGVNPTRHVMQDGRPGPRDAEDLPWNDAPADSDLFPGHDEPDPAEVLGDEGAEYDVAVAHIPPDPYHRDSLDERLAQEEPDDPAIGPGEPVAAALQAPERGGGDVYLAEEDSEEYDEPSAEEAAIHVREA